MSERLSPAGPMRRVTCWCAGGRALTLGQVHLVNEAGQHVTILDVEVVVRPEDVGRDDGGEGAAMLLEVGPAGAQRLLWPSSRDHPPHSGLLQTEKAEAGKEGGGLGAAGNPVPLLHPRTLRPSPHSRGRCYEDLFCTSIILLA